MTDSLFGVGLRPTHYSAILESHSSSVTWFEVISENYMNTEGRPIQILEQIRENYPIALHGVSLSIAGFRDLNLEYLKSLKRLIERIDPVRISDHFCWTGLAHSNIHDLLPIPFTTESINHLVNRIQQVQNFLGRQILLENVSSYLTYKNSEMTEWEFINEVSKKSGCGLLLDINNIYVNAINHHYEPHEFLNAMDETRIGQIHLAGFSDRNGYLFDTHSKPVYSEVWKLYEAVAKRFKDIPVMIEWDDDIPSYSVLLEEIGKAKTIWQKVNQNELKDYTNRTC